MAVNISNGFAGTNNIYIGNSGNYYDKVTIAIPISVDDETKKYSITPTSAYIKAVGNGVPQTAEKWVGTAQNNFTGNCILFIQGSAADTVEISYDTEGSAKKTELTISATAPTEASYPLTNSNALANLSAGQAGGSPIPLTPTEPVNGNPALFAFNKAIDTSGGTIYDNSSHIGMITNNENYPYNANLELADQNNIWATNNNTNYEAICATVQRTIQPGDNNVNFDVYSYQLTINPVIQGLSYMPDGTTDQETPIAQYIAGTAGFSPINNQIALLGSGNMDSTHVLSSTSSNYPYLNIILTPILTLNQNTPTNNEFAYGAGAGGQLTFQNQVNFYSSNTSIATIPILDGAPQVKFGSSPGTSQLIAQANNGYRNITSLNAPLLANRYIALTIPSSVISLTGITLGGSPYTVTNYATPQTQVLDMDLTVSPDTGQIPALNDLTITLTSNDGTVTTFTNGLFKSGDPKLNGITFIQDTTNGNPISINYNSATATASPGTYSIELSYKNADGTEATGTGQLIVQESSVKPQAFITYHGENVTVSSPGTFDQTTGNSFQVGINPGSLAPVQDITYSLISAPENVIINPNTGMIKLLGSVTTGTQIQIQAIVNGVKSELGQINITGITTQNSGLEAIQKTVYLAQGATFDSTNNILIIEQQQTIDQAGTELQYDFSVIPTVSNQVAIANTGVITVNANCPDGTYTINVAQSSNGNIKTSFNVVVSKALVATGINIVPTEMNLSSDTMESETISASLLPSGATSLGSFTFVECNSLGESLENSPTGIINLNETTGEVTALSPGTTYVLTTWTADSPPPGPFTGITQVNVTETPVQTTISIIPNNLKLNLIDNKTGDLTVSVSPSEYVSQVVWSVENQNIATINPTSGNQTTVTAQGAGSTVVTATINGVSATATIVVSDSSLEPESFTVSPNPMYLTTLTGTGNITSNQIDVEIEPEGAEADITYSSSAQSVAQVDSTGLVTAVSPGEAEITVTVGDLEPQIITVYVSNDSISNGGVTITPSTAGNPDYFNITVKTIPNPAIAGGTATVQQVSCFSWSTDDQSDINAKVMTNAGNGTFTLMNVPVNNNDYNTFFVEADKIYVNIYASTVAGENGSMIFAGDYSWVEDMPASNSVYYIGYVQNIAFDRPTVSNGATAGTTGNALQMEGLRVSSNVPGVEILTDVHMQNIGWYSETIGNGQYYEDGAYAGTMHENRQIEAVRFRLVGENASHYTIRANAHIENIGWQGWVTGSNVAVGSTGNNLQMEAIQIQLVPVN